MKVCKSNGKVQRLDSELIQTIPIHECVPLCFIETYLQLIIVNLTLNEGEDIVRFLKETLSSRIKSLEVRYLCWR